MTEDDLKELMPQLEAFHKRFHGFFCRTEGRQWSRKYLIGLLLPIVRKNVENIAEEVGAPPRKLQEFLSDSPWDDEGCIEDHQRFVGEMFGAPNGVVILDDTGFPKKGDKSAGVGRTIFWYPGQDRQLPGWGVHVLCFCSWPYAGGSAVVHPVSVV